MTADAVFADALAPTPDRAAPGARIGGRPVAGGVHELPDPATGSTFARVGWVDTTVVDAAVTAAAEALPVWSAIAARERARALRGIAADIRKRAEEFADLITAETGKRRAEALGEAMFSAAYFDWFADAATMPVDQHLSNTQRRFVVRRHPVGVVAAVSPWNFPLSIPARKIAPALAAGCPVVLKPSELTPLSGVALVELCERHLPSGVVGVVVGDGEKLTTTLVDHPEVASMSFTGSTRVGALVAARAMESMTRVTMELGGKAPFVVCADADPTIAVDALMVAKFRNNGASCLAANNVFVHESLYGQVLTALRERITSMTVGDPRSQHTDLGPLLRPDQVTRLHRLMNDAESAGCSVTRGSAPDSDGYYCTPALVEASADVALWTQEVFGPVLVVRPFTEEDTVVSEINRWRTGLGGYVVSRDAQHGLDLAGRMRIGIVGINNGAPNTPEVPFGGFGYAGMGREGGLSGLHEFTEEQTLSLAR